LLPTLADCTPVVFSEASAMGVPILSRNVGGISDVVRDGANGFLFDTDAPAAVYADRIVELMSRPKDYTELAFSSLREYEQRLNWNVSGAALSGLLRSLL
jgi:glycosyltransferase involved in cell wall biosynthesis